MDLVTATSSRESAPYPDVLLFGHRHMLRASNGTELLPSRVAEDCEIDIQALSLLLLAKDDAGEPPINLQPDEAHKADMEHTSI